MTDGKSVLYNIPRSNKLNLYIASSWDNVFYDDIFGKLKRYRFLNVYDFKNSKSQEKIMFLRDKKIYCTNLLKELIKTDSQKQLDKDMNFIKHSDVCLLVLPCGKSAHIEAGIFIGRKKPLIIYFTADKPELLYGNAELITSDINLIIDNLKQLYMKKEAYT